MIYIYESNTGDFQATLGHLRTAGPELRKVWGTFARFADIARIKSDSNTISGMASSQAGIERHQTYDRTAGS